MANGVLNIDKPMDMTSHDLVNIVRKVLKTRSVGHTGTLDPNATGVMNIVVGRYTKLIPYLNCETKSYTAGFEFGLFSDTLDIWGDVQSTAEKKNIEKYQLDNAIKEFIGEITQLPPMYSAVKINGKKLYEYAREGLEVERQPRKAYIHSIKLIDYENGRGTIEVACSKGTYIRTLIDDIAVSLDTRAIMTSLVRTKNENIRLDECISIDDLRQSNFEMSDEALLKMLPANGIIEVDEKALKLIKNGMKIDLISYKKQNSSNGEYAILFNGILEGIAREFDGKILFQKMF